MKKITRKYEKKTKKVLYKVFEMCYCLNKQKTACSPVQLATVKTWKEYGYAGR